MNILFLTQVLPYPLDAGPKVRGYYNLRYLTARHSVTLVSFIRNTDSADALLHLKKLCKNVITVPMLRSKARDGIAMIKSLLINEPFLITRDQVNEMDLKLREIIRQEKFDAIHADQLWMAPYVLRTREEAKKSGYTPRIILDQHNAVFLIPKRMADSSDNPFVKIWLEREAVLMADYEKRVCSQFDGVVWVTKEDRVMVTSLLTKDRAADREIVQKGHDFLNNNNVIPICIDPENYGGIADLADTQNILFLGGMHWPPNADGVIWFTKEVLPLILKNNAQARFFAIGKRPPEELKVLKDFVIAPGYVEDVDDYWSKSRVFVVPLRAGGGMRVKILDAWAKGIPIVSTTIGAEGINYTAGQDILIADTPEAFAQAVQQILMDKDFAKRLSVAGRMTLENCYDWEKIYPAWEKVYS